MAFQPSITQTIKTLFHNNRFVIPDYQRKYSWIYEQRSALWDDIGENLKMKHFIGTLCFQKIEDTDEIINEVYEVIDGQQRITTLYILLNTLIIQLEDIDKRTAYSTLYIGNEKSPKLIPLGTDEAFMRRLIFDYNNIDPDTIKSRSQKNLYQAKREFFSKSKNFTQAQFLHWIEYISVSIHLTPSFPDLKRVLTLRKIKKMRQRKKTEMYPLVEAWQTSGKSKTAFSQSQGLKLHTFLYWVNKYEGEQSSSGPSKEVGNFIPLSIDKPITGDKIEIAYPNGVKLRLSGMVSSSYLLELINLSAHV